MGNIINNPLRTTLIKYERQSGNSTRLIDSSIRILFEEGIVIATDHYRNGTDRAANRNLFYKVLGRLRLEHNINELIIQKKLFIDEERLTISLSKSSKEIDLGRELIEKLQPFVEEGLINNIEYTRLALSKELYSRYRNLKSINIYKTIDIIETSSNNEYEYCYLIDMSKCKWDGRSRFTLIEQTLISQGVIKLIEL